MKHAPRLILLFAVLLSLTIGCGNQEEATPDSQDLAGRLAAAQAINSQSARDSALAAVAISAGEAGNGQVANEAVQGILSQSTRDTTAAEAALALAKAGQSTAATELANRINSESTRDQTLSTIATAGE
jgi:chromosomal replication initiation ATPase DnaA